MFDLCSKCFSDFANHEILTISTFGPCNECGIYNDHQNGVIINSFRRDPRLKPKEKINNIITRDR